MRSLVLLALLFAFIGLSSSTIYWKNAMDMKKDLQNQIDWVLQSINDKDNKLYIELVQQGSTFDWFLADRKHNIKNIVIQEAKFMDDVFQLVQGIGLVYDKSETKSPFYVRLGMFKNGKTRTGYMMYDALSCADPYCTFHNN
ncbi:hypothetical protein CAEBREN_05036 [Caenorhabditis brenneri]|uniref:Uncharacterized protein n=1 Tax=Caenorhabditis brenneri TaxID=135651 RepID=G0NLB2_CAEBE|nr:hypothetical protein CAEBREN_05036 [Caenorhabditis brenneri]